MQRAQGAVGPASVQSAAQQRCCQCPGPCPRYITTSDGESCNVRGRRWIEEHVWAVIRQ